MDWVFGEWNCGGEETSCVTGDRDGGGQDAYLPLGHERGRLGGDGREIGGERDERGEDVELAFFRRLMSQEMGRRGLRGYQSTLPRDLSVRREFSKEMKKEEGNLLFFCF